MKNKIISVLLSVALAVTALPLGNVGATENTVGIETNEVETNEVENVFTTIQNIETESDSETKDLSEENTIFTAETYSFIEENKIFNITDSGKVVGTDNVEYKDVIYLSADTVRALPSDVQSAYITLCDEIAKWNQAGDGVKDIVIAADSDGSLHATYAFPYMFNLCQDKLTEEVINEFANEETETFEIRETVTETNETETEEIITSVTTETETKEEITETEEEKVTDEETTETEEEIVTDEEITETETDEEITTEVATDTETEEIETEAETEEIATEESSEIEAQETVLIAENMELLAVYEEETFEVPQEVVADKIIDLGYDDGKVINDINTFIPDKKHFYNQLNNIEKVVYDAAYKSFSSGKTAFSFRGPSVTGVVDVNMGMSAVIMTEPALGEFIDKSMDEDIKFKYSYYPGDKDYEFTLTLKKSQHYTSEVINEANKKIKELAEAAQQYALKNYPKAPVYGIVKYFDKWICENNYYNMSGIMDLGDVEEYYFCHSSFGILLKGYGVCESYALAMSKLLDAVGIPNMYVIGHIVSIDRGHAWNYIKMPDAKWYLTDCTWNDPENKNATSTGEYLLCADDGKYHTAVGNVFTRYRIEFEFADISKTNYKPSEETLKFTQSEYNLKAKDKVALSCTNAGYIEGMSQTWSSSDSKVAKVDKNGNVTAVKPGTATITLSSDRIKGTCTINVHKVDKVAFSESKKINENITDGISQKSKPVRNMALNVTHKVEKYTIEQLISKGIYNVPTVVSSNEDVATVTYKVSGNNINIAIKPKAIGKTKIIVKFEGKTATVNYTVKEQIDSSWFKVDTKAVTYTGTAFKPSVEKTSLAPEKLKFKVKHIDNKNAGTAKVIISGTGNYGGEIEYKYKINQADISTAVFAKCTESKVYVGAPIVPATTVKLGKKTLSAKTDYELYYNGNKTPKENVGKYTITVYGKGNYKGKVSETKTFEIKQTTISKVKVTVPSKAKYTGSVIKPEPVVSIGKNKLSNMNYYVSYHMKDNAAKDKVGAKINPKEPGDYVVVITVEGSGVKNKNIVNTKNKTQIIKQFKIVK